MRVNWMIPAGMYINHGEVLNACAKFYDQYKMAPDTIKLTYQDYHNLMSYMPQNLQVHEVGKEYKQVLPIPGGFVEVCLLDDADEVLAGSNIVNNSMVGNAPGQYGSQISTSPTIMVVESNKVDREFEKHVLKT